jgi:hypothetical protein
MSSSCDPVFSAQGSALSPRLRGELSGSDGRSPCRSAASPQGRDMCHDRWTLGPPLLPGTTGDALGRAGLGVDREQPSGGLMATRTVTRTQDARKLDMRDRRAQPRIGSGFHEVRQPLRCEHPWTMGLPCPRARHSFGTTRSSASIRLPRRYWAPTQVPPRRRRCRAGERWGRPVAVR